MKTKIQMKKTKDQYTLMLQKWMALQQHAYQTRKGDGLHIDNAAWADFEEEFAEFIKQKALIHSPWGESLKQRIEAIRELPAFKDLKLQWMKQCHTKSGLDFKTSFDDFLGVIAKNVPLTDKPEVFEDSYFVDEFFKMVGM